MLIDEKGINPAILVQELCVFHRFYEKKLSGECCWNFMIRSLDLANHTVSTTLIPPLML